MDVPPTARPARNQRQKLRSNEIPFISSPMPLKRTRAGRTGWGVDPSSTSSPSPNLTRQYYSPSATPTERDQTHISTGTSNSSDLDLRASGMAQPAKTLSGEVIKKPNSASSVFPTLPGQRPPRPLPGLLVTGPGSSQPLARDTADSPGAPTRTSASEPSTTRRTKLGAGEPSGSDQLSPSYHYVATSQLKGSASDKVGGLDEELFRNQHYS
ncbi:hypothetical protein FRC04_009957 [Tulasnella sp. 424]|nr:hypothetical protein FRC04_009957 [Tulasnella sp. 424]